MSARNLALLATLGSVALMLGALGFQFIGGFPPCKMCYWQRWPHYTAILIGVIAYFVPNRVLYAFGGLAALATSVVGFYHAGVEQKFWAGPTSCTGGGLSLTDNLLDMSASVKLVLCDEIVWDLFGVTMAAWNGLFSLVLAVIWFMAFRKA